jgi:hypothetical protein
VRKEPQCFLAMAHCLHGNLFKKHRLSPRERATMVMLKMEGLFYYKALGGRDTGGKDIDR